MLKLDKKNEYLKKFSGKKVFITGHTGFKGSWLAFVLQQYGAIIKGFAFEPKCDNSHFKELELEHTVDNVYGDINNKENLKEAIISFQPEYVFHLAAQALVKKSYDDPLETFNTNIIGSANLLDAVRACKSVRSLVYITSDKCYENVEWLWGYRETDKLGGRDPYSASKAAAEIIFSSFYRSFLSSRDNMGAASTRAGNVIGGGDWAADRIIPDCIRAFKDDGTVVLRNPQSTRPWQHVLEPISGYLLLATKIYDEPNKYSGSWNFGPKMSQPLTVEEVTRNIIKHYGKGNIKVEKLGEGFYEANLLQLNCDKANQKLLWSPRWSVEKTLEVTANWYKRFHNGEAVQSITGSQINEYFSEMI